MAKLREAGTKSTPRSSQQPTNSVPTSYQDPAKNQPTTHQRTNETNDEQTSDPIRKG